MNRSGAGPRSLLILFLVALLAIGGLWLARHKRTVDYTLGGPLFPVEADQIEGLLLTKSGLQFRFDRQDNGRWSLSGAANDYLDTQAMSALVGQFPIALGGAVLPGTQREDRRYNFNGPEAMRVRVFLSGGADITLALGALNPVSGHYYASGAGRQECFPVAGPFRDKLFMLPTTVQAKRLLPDFEREVVQRLLVTRGGVEHEFVRRDGHWWLRLQSTDPEPDWRGFPRLVQDYQAQYDDRRRQDKDGVWLMASGQAVGQLIYEVSETVVRDFISPGEAAARLGQWELVPPWRQVVLQGVGLNQDPGAPLPDQYTLAFGPPLDEKRVPVLRRGNVLITDLDAVNLLEKGLDVLVEQFALNDVARRADKLLVEREGVQVLLAGRTGPQQDGDGRGSWLTSYPASGTAGLDEKNRNGLSRDLVVNLNRLQILAVLPPSNDPGVLQQKQRVRITLTWDRDQDNRELVVETGYLTADLPGIAGAGPAAGLWFPATGKLLQVPESLLVTVRNMADYARNSAGN